MAKDWESVIEKQIRQATERGDFDDLPGTGKPLTGIDEPYDENWWVKGLLRREAMPDSPALRAEIEALPARVARLTLELSVRDIVKDLNTRIRQHGGVPPIDVNAVVAEWRANRPSRRR
jgi:hypothetical protein